MSPVRSSDKRSETRLHLLLMLVSTLLLVATLGACSDEEETPAEDTGDQGDGIQEDHTVTISNFQFSPANLTVAVGDIIRWVNNDDFAHTVSSGNSDTPTTVFDSGEIAGGGNFIYSVVQSGSIDYYCQIHPQMEGNINAP